jgi:putative endonuclease
VRSYYVYMLRCFDGTFYVGITNDFERRYFEHCQGIDSECYTYHLRPLQVAYVGEFERIDDAIAFEKQLKSWSHRKKRAFAERAWSSLNRYSRGLNRSDLLKRLV